MSLRVWLPLNGSLENKGLDDVTVINNGATVDNNGKIGKCYIFGTSSYLKVPLPKLSEYSTTTFSMCLWVKVPSPTNNNKQFLHIGKGSGWTNSRFTILYRGSTTVSQVVTSISDGSSYGAYNCYADIPIDTWIHIASVFDNRKLKLYINGELKNTYNTTYDLSFDSIEALGIGGAPNGAELLKSGYINDVRIYDHALSPMEVKQISQGLVLHYPLNHGGLGQENLLLNTQILTPNSSTTTKNCSQRGSAKRQLRTDGFYEAKCTSAWQGLSTWANAQNLVVGQKYTYSFYFYTDGSIKQLSFYPMMFNSSGTRDTSSTLPISVDGSTYQNANAEFFGSFSNTSPVKHYATFEWNNTMASIINNGGTIELSIQVSGTFKSGEYGCVYAPKLEIGDKPTPWCPNKADELATTMGLNDTIEYDCSGYGNNGTRIGAFNWTSDTPRYSVSTHIGATSSKIHISDFPTSGFGDSYSFAWWGKRNSNSPMFWGFSDGIRLNGMFLGTLWNTDDGRSNPIYKPNTTTTITAPSLNVWHHYVMTGDGSVCKLYIDGEFYGQAKIYKAISGTSIYINGLDAGTSYCSDNTDISDFRIYATALSPEDVLDLYNLGAAIDTNNNLYGAMFEEV